MKVVALLGIDGSGKTTLARGIQKRFKEKGIRTSILSVGGAKASIKWLQESRLALGLLGLIFCLLYPFLVWMLRREGNELLLVEHHPHTDLGVYAHIYGALPRCVSLLSKYLYRRPDAAVHIDVTVQRALENIQCRPGKKRQWHETTDKLERLAVLLRKEAVCLSSIKMIFPASSIDAFDQLHERLMS